MSEVFYVRHQAHGIVHEFPFSARPTAEQFAAVARFCFQIWGHGPQRTPGVAYTMGIASVPLLGAEDVPVVAARALSSARSLGATEFEVRGRGHVTPPGE